MPRRKVRAAFPTWYRFVEYRKAAGLDAADWYLNLRLRYWLMHRESSSVPHAQDELRQLLRNRPIQRRAQQDDDDTLFWLVGHDMRLVSYREHLLRILKGECPMLKAIEELTPAGLYWLESTLPAKLRETGSQFWAEPDPARRTDPGPDFWRPIENLRPQSRQLMNQAVRLNLSLSPELLAEQVRQWATRKRQAVQETHPEAAMLVEANDVALNRWDDARVLDWIDLQALKDTDDPEPTHETMIEQFGLECDPRSFARTTIEKWGRKLTSDLFLNSHLLPRVIAEWSPTLPAGEQRKKRLSKRG